MMDELAGRLNILIPRVPLLWALVGGIMLGLWVFIMLMVALRRKWSKKEPT